MIPDSDTFVPEFGLCLPPELALSLEFEGLPLLDQVDDTLNLSDPLRTTPTQVNDFNLPDYGMSAGHDLLESDFDFSGGGFTADDDDILRNVDDAEHLDFNLDSTPLHPGKRIAQDVVSSPSKRMNASIDDSEIQRIAREDHENVKGFQFNGFGSDMGGFGDPNFDIYKSPPPQENDAIGNTVEEISGPRAKKRRRLVIVEDDTPTIPDDEFRKWPERYIETQAAAISRRRDFEMTKLAKTRATRFLWDWNGRDNASLHPLLLELFSRDAFVACWKAVSQSGNTTGKRKRDEIDGEVENAMVEFGGTGGFNSMDFPVHPIQIQLIQGNGSWPSRSG